MDPEAGRQTRLLKRTDNLARLRIWQSLFALGAIAIAGYLLHRAVERYGIDAIVASVQGFTAGQLVPVGLFAVASYLCLTGFDALALRYVRQDVPYPYVAMTSFTSLSLGHNIGFAALSSGTIRFRLYSRYGLTAADIARLIVFCGVTVGLGLITLAGIVLAGRAQLASGALGVPTGVAVLLGAACICIAAGYVAACRFIRRPVSVRGFSLSLPSPGLALGQILVGTLNFALVAGCVHQAIGVAHDVPYLAVVAVYVLANLVAVISHVPGGLGVIESVVLTLIPGETVLGGLIVFRIAYYFIPLILGTIIFALSELVRSRRRNAVRAGSRSAGSTIGS
ncbi:MAG: UPF0104 family protein [Alphaproteobacteria bacterium]